VVGDRLFSDLPKPFACVCTDLNSGNEVWLQEGAVIEAIRASCALPGLVPAAQVDDRWLLDGALVNPVPVSLCRALGAQLVIAVNLNADGFDELNDPGNALPMEDSLADETALGKWMANLPGADFFQKVASHRKNEPSILTVMTQSLNIVQDRISRSRLAGDPPDVTLTPRLGQIGLLQFDRAGECIRLGEEAVDQAGHALAHFQRRMGIAPRDHEIANPP
jgi:NTE family protein